jgi:hypothetical protein
VAERGNHGDSVTRGIVESALAFAQNVADHIGCGGLSDESFRALSARHVDAVAVVNRDQPARRQSLSANEGGEIFEQRIGRQNVSDASVIALNRHVDRHHQSGADGAHIEIGNDRQAGREHLPGGLQIRPDRKRRTRWQQRVHQLLAVFFQKDEIGAGKPQRDDGLRQCPKGRDVVVAQRRRKCEDLQGHHAGLQLLLDHLCQAAGEFQSLSARDGDRFAVLQVLAAQAEGQQRHDAGHHEE